MEIKRQWDPPHHILVYNSKRQSILPSQQIMQPMPKGEVLHYMPPQQVQLKFKK